MTQPAETNVWLVASLWFAGLGAAAQFGKISVMFAMLGGVYPGAGIGFMVSLVGLTGLVFGTTAGLLVQRIGYRRVLVGALASGAAISAFQATLPVFSLMMASRVVEGFSHLAIVVAGPVLMAQVTALRHQGMVMTLWASFFGVSFALMAWLGAPLAAAYGPPALFLAHAVFMAGLALVLLRQLPPDPPGAGPPTLSLAGLIRQHGAIYRSPFIPAAALGFVFYTLMYVALLTLLPPMTGPGERMIVATLMPLASTVISLTLGVWLLRFMSAVGLVQFGLALAGLFVVLLAVFWNGPLAVIVFSLALSGALGLVQGASFNVIAQLNASAEDRAKASGALAQLGNLGTTSGTPVLNAMIAGMGIAGVVVFALPLCLAGIAMHFWLAARRRRAQARLAL